MRMKANVLIINEEERKHRLTHTRSRLQHIEVERSERKIVKRNKGKKNQRDS